MPLSSTPSLGEALEGLLVGDRPGHGLAQSVDVLLRRAFECGERCAPTRDELVDVRCLLRRDRPSRHAPFPLFRVPAPDSGNDGAYDRPSRTCHRRPRDLTTSDTWTTTFLIADSIVRYVESEPRRAARRPRCDGPIDSGRPRRAVPRRSRRRAAFSASAVTPTSRSSPPSSGTGRRASPRPVTSRSPPMPPMACPRIGQARRRAAARRSRASRTRRRASPRRRSTSVPLLVIAGDVPVLLRGPRAAPGVQPAHATRTRSRSTNHSSSVRGACAAPTRCRASSPAPGISPLAGRPGPGARVGADGHPRRAARGRGRAAIARRPSGAQRADRRGDRRTAPLGQTAGAPRRGRDAQGGGAGSPTRRVRRAARRCTR